MAEAVKNWITETVERTDVQANDFLLMGVNSTKATVRVRLDKIGPAIGASTNVALKGTAVASTNPGSPTTPQYYLAKAGTTYTYFLDSGSNPITIPAKLGDKYVATPRLVFNGTNWTAEWELTDDVDLTGYALEADLLPVSDAVNQITIGNSQLFDKSQAVKGSISADGSLNTSSDNWCSSGFIPVLAGNDYTSSGHSANTSTSLAIAFYNSSQVFISGVAMSGQTTYTAEAPVGAAFMRHTIANAVGAGLNPTNNAFSNAFMVNEGDTALPWEAYGVRVPAGKVEGLPEAVTPVINDNPKVSTSDVFRTAVQYVGRQLFNKLQAVKGSLSLAGVLNTGSDNWCASGFIPVIAGTDYTSSGHTPSNVDSLAIAFYNSSNVFISGVKMSGQTSYTATAPAGAAFMRHTIANAVGVGLNPTGNAYSNAFMVNEGDTALPWEAFGVLGVDGQKVFNLPTPPAPEATYPDGFYEFSPTAHSGRERFIVYTKIPGSRDRYAGIVIGHDYDMSELVYADMYRIIGAALYIYNGTAMTAVSGKTLLTPGESECVYLTANKVDFTGGVHGDETMISAAFFADGVIIGSLASSIPLTACNTFEYRQKSEMHETAATGPVVNPLHPVEAIHDKITTISNGGYRTFNRLTWQAAGIPVTLWYHGIACIGKVTGNRVENEYLESFTPNGDNANKIERTGAREYYASHSTENLSATATAALLKPAAQDAACFMFVWDRASADNKYYRRFSPGSNPANGEVWESEMTVKFGGRF